MVCMHVCIIDDDRMVIIMKIIIQIFGTQFHIKTYIAVQPSLIVQCESATITDCSMCEQPLLIFQCFSTLNSVHYVQVLFPLYSQRYGHGLIVSKCIDGLIVSYSHHQMPVHLHQFISHSQHSASFSQHARPDGTYFNVGRLYLSLPPPPLPVAYQRMYSAARMVHKMM